MHDVVRAWQLRAAAAPAVDAYLDSGRDETGFVDPTAAQLLTHR